MQRQINISLLKEYIKTLIVAEVIFPGTRPRQWGNEFSRTELKTIHFTLKFVLQTATTSQTNVSFAKVLKQAEEPDLNLHWFLYNYWEMIIPILAKYPYSYVPAAKLSYQYELN